MGLKTLSLSEHFQWPKRNVLSGFGLSVVVSLLICAVLFLSRSLNNPIPLSLQANSDNPKLESFNDSDTPQLSKNSSLVDTLNTPSKEEEEGKLKFESLNDSEEPQVKNSTFIGLNSTSSEEEASETTRVINGGSSFEECDFFEGKWVRDESKPYYPEGSCPYIDKDFDCHYNQRPEDEYVKWRWQPNGCDIPSLNATEFLERLRGQKLVFVGDSLNRNMWESLVCILWNSVGDKKRVYEISGKTEFKKKGFYAFIFEDYNCTVDFVSSPFLVQESTFKGKNGTFQTLRIDLMDRTTSMYVDADILIFNTGHWWTHEKTSKGEDYYQEGNYIHPRLKMLEAFTRALKTWAKWVDNNIDSNRTRVFFRGFSATHFRRGLWNSGGQCHEDIVPFNSTYIPKYNSKMRALDNVLRGMRTPVSYLNISGLTGYRKDAHPSVYRMKYKSVSEQMAGLRSQDCSHWCLPGVPDTWNELLYASLLRSSK